MLKVATESVRILAYGKWEDVIGESADRKDGSPSEFVTVLLGDGETERCTMTADVNGSRPDVLSEATLEGELVRRDGKLKLRVTGFREVAKPAKAS
jgi:hypothetical protein